MLLGALLSFVASVLALAHAVQLPIKPGHRWQEAPQSILRGDEPMQWSLDEIPNPNVTDHLVFETVYSLLQHWPSMYMINGHSIVPGIIPERTLLYHATDRKTLPQSAEWVALDPEHAYYYCREKTDFGSSQQACWLLTLTTTRPLEIHKTSLHGGESLPEHQWDESERAEKLCGWGKNFGIDGFDKNGFVILCDFTAGASVVSFLNIVRVPGGLWDFSIRLVDIETLRAGGWHNHFPGETRVRLDLAGLISFYDTELVPSLVAIRVGQERQDHRVRDVSKKDLSAVVSRLEEALTRPSGLSSGVDWKTLIQVIVDRYAGRLELTQHLVNSSVTSADEILDLAVKTQTQLRIMLTPYLRVSAIPIDSPDNNAVDWMVPVYRDCATTHMKYAASKLGSMTDPEKLLLRAVQGTNREICRVVTKMWAAGVYTGIDPSLNTKDSVDIAEVTRVWKVWAEDLNRLMAWLDWNVWIKCKPGCDPEEICILHRWPLYIPPSSFTQEGEIHVAGRASKRNWPAAITMEIVVWCFDEYQVGRVPRKMIDARYLVKSGKLSKIRKELDEWDEPTLSSAVDNADPLFLRELAMSTGDFHATWTSLLN